MLYVEVRPIATIDLQDLQQIRSPFHPYLNRATRRRDDNNANLHLSRYQDAEHHYRQRLGQILFLPNSITNRLQQRIVEANALMSKSPPIGTFCSRHSDAIVIRTILTEGSIIHYTIDSKSGELLRCVLDKSVTSVVGKIVVSSFLSNPNGVFFGLQNPSKILALPFRVASQTEPVYNLMHLASGHGWVDNFDRQPLTMDIDADGRFLCVGYRHRIGFVSLGNSKLQSNSAEIQRKSISRRSLVIRSQASDSTVSVRKHSEIPLGHTNQLIACFWLKSAARTVLVISQEKINSSTYRLLVATYQLNESSELHRPLNNLHIDIAHAVSCTALDNCHGRLSVLLDDSTAVLIDLVTMSCIYQVKLASRARPSAIVWHPDDAILAVAFTDGEIKAFDSAFQDLPFISGKILLNVVLGVHSHATHLAWMNNLLVAVADRGPLFTLRIIPGLRHQGGITDQILLQERLRLLQFDEAAAVISLSRNVTFRLEAFMAMVQVLLCLDDTVVIQQLIPSDRLSLCFREIWPLCKGTSYAEHVRCLYQRFILRLISTKQIESAFYHAEQIDDEILFMDLYSSAKRLRHDVIARLAYKRCHALHFTNGPPSENKAELINIDISSFSEMMKLTEWQCHQFEEKNRARLLGVALIKAHRYQDAEQLYRKFFLESELKSMQSFRAAIQQTQLPVDLF